MNLTSCHNPVGHTKRLSLLRRCRVAQMHGLSLIELLITMVVSVFLMLGVVNVYISSKASDDIRREVSEMEENARTALMILRRLIGHAGYQSVNDLTLESGFYSAGEDMPNPVCRDGQNTLISYRPILDEKTKNSATAKRDTMVTVHIADSPRMGDESTGLLINDCQSSEIPVACSSDTVQGLQNPAEARIYNYLYINTPKGRRALTCMGSRGGAQPLAEDIENMQFLYGVRQTDGVVYRTAQSVSLNHQWGSVVTVQVGLLVRSKREVLKQKSSKRFLLLDETVKTPRDRRLYKTYTTTIMLPNRLQHGGGI